MAMEGGFVGKAVAVAVAVSAILVLAAPAAADQAVRDPSFEGFETDDSPWVTGGTARPCFNNESTCAYPFIARTGLWYIGFDSGLGSVKQQITIANPPATLKFFLDNPTVEPGDPYFAVSIDGVDVFGQTMTPLSDWTEFDVDVSQFADGGQHTLRLFTASEGRLIALDDVHLFAAPGSCSPSSRSAGTNGCGEVERHLTLRYRRHAFRGRLKPRGPCARRERVIVFRKRNGERFRVGRDKTNRRGRYVVNAPDPRRGNYFAKARRTEEPALGTCLAVRSKRLPLR
jgi:hypothetical protein